MKLINIKTSKEVKKGDSVILRGDNLKLKIDSWFSPFQLSEELKRTFPTGLVYLYSPNHRLDYYKPESCGLKFN